MITLVIKNRFMRFKPVLLSSVLDHFEGFEHQAQFYALVQEYMPEERARLLELTTVDAAKEFVQLFSKRYFPIEEPSPGYMYGGAPDGIHMIDVVVQSIRLQFHGLDQYDYEVAAGRNMRYAQLLAETICVCPFEGRDDRIAVLAEFSKQVDGRRANPLLKLLPPEGMLLKDIANTLVKTEYASLIIWCRWVFHATGNIWLDTADRRFEQTAWSRDNVDALTLAWKPYLELDEEMQKFDKWLKKDFAGRSKEIIQYLGEHRPKYLIESITGDVNAE